MDAFDYTPEQSLPHVDVISQFYLASIHPECAGSVGNALRESLGIRVKLNRVDPKSSDFFESFAPHSVAIFIDTDGLEEAEIVSCLKHARSASLVPVMLVENLGAISPVLIDEYKIWSCIETFPEGRFRKAVQSTALDLINFHMLNEVEDAIRDGYHKTTREKPFS